MYGKCFEMAANWPRNRRKRRGRSGYVTRTTTTRTTRTRKDSKRGTVSGVEADEHQQKFRHKGDCFAAQQKQQQQPQAVLTLKLI